MLESHCVDGSRIDISAFIGNDRCLRDVVGHRRQYHHNFCMFDHIIALTKCFRIVFYVSAEFVWEIVKFGFFIYQVEN